MPLKNKKRKKALKNRKRFVSSCSVVESNEESSIETNSIKNTTCCIENEVTLRTNTRIDERRLANINKKEYKCQVIRKEQEGAKCSD